MAVIATDSGASEPCKRVDHLSVESDASHSLTGGFLARNHMEFRPGMRYRCASTATIVTVLFNVLDAM